MVKVAMMLVAATSLIVIPDTERHVIGIGRTTYVLEIVVAEQIRAIRLMHHATVLADINWYVLGDLLVLQVMEYLIHMLFIVPL